MMNTGKKMLVLLLAGLQTFFSFAQQDTANKPKLQLDSLPHTSDSLTRRLHVAIFTPLYLDSAFDGINNYRYGKTFPRFINPGLEFYEGAQLAIDSLQKEGAVMDFHVFDTRSVTKPLYKLLQDSLFNNIDLMMGHVSAYEAKLLADAAGKRKVPFVNVNFPNDAGVTKNPYYIVLNSTLFSHIQGLYRFLQRNYALSNITVFTKSKGPLENLFREYITTIEKSTASVPLKLRFVTLLPTFTSRDILKNLDSNITNICIVGSLDVQFGQLVCEQLSEVSNSYTSTIFGMPTWDIVDFTKPLFRNLEIFYSTPFYIAPTDKTAVALNSHFKTRFYSRPTDMVFRGYETVYHFSRLLLQHRMDFHSAIAVKKFRIFTDFDIQPVTDSLSLSVNYFENKKIFFVKKVDGIVKGVY